MHLLHIWSSSVSQKATKPDEILFNLQSLFERKTNKVDEQLIDSHRENVMMTKKSTFYRKSNYYSFIVLKINEKYRLCDPLIESQYWVNATFSLGLEQKDENCITEVN